MDKSNAGQGGKWQYPRSCFLKEETQTFLVVTMEKPISGLRDSGDNSQYPHTFGCGWNAQQCSAQRAVQDQLRRAKQQEVPANALEGQPGTSWHCWRKSQ